MLNADVSISIDFLKVFYIFFKIHIPINFKIERKRRH